jgi:23S rRNA pseudouridine1911/1915/1917 synthase
MPVSGCLLLAKTQAAAAFLGKAFARHGCLVEKRYWAITELPKSENALPQEGELVHWLGFDSKTNKSFAFPLERMNDTAAAKRRKGLKKAILRYRIAGRGEHYLFLEIDLVTGRHHQIRAQLAALGLHIKGDLKYGARRSEKSGGIRLHAYSLAFPNPLRPDEMIRVQAPPPVADSLWSAFLEAAGR